MRQALGSIFGREGGVSGKLAAPSPNPDHFVPVSTSGTQIFSGIIAEEYLEKLTGWQAAFEYDMMRRSDSQVRALLTVVKNPILSANWYIEPVDESDEEKEIADFASYVLFEDIGYPDGSKRKTWQDFLMEALSMIEFGHSVFEVINKVVRDDDVWGDYVGLSDIAWRSPKTIQEWGVAENGALAFIEQQITGDLMPSTDRSVGAIVTTPGRFLIVLTINKEGDNYEGISGLRSIYGNYVRRDLYSKIQAIGVERGASGVPVIKIPDDRTGDPKARSLIAKIVASYTSYQNAGITLPAGYEIDNFTITHKISEVQAAIEAEAVEMIRAFGAQFITIGSKGSGGGYAQSVDQSDMFLSGLALYADKIANAVNDNILRQLIDAKFGRRDAYPIVRHSGINDKGGKALAETLKTLIEVGLVQPTESMQQWTAERYELPENEDTDSVTGEELAPTGEEVNRSVDPEGDGNAEEVNPEAGFPEEGEDSRLSAPVTLTRAQELAVLLAAPTLGEITRNSKQLQEIMERHLGEVSSQYVSDVVKAIDTNQGAAQRAAALAVKMKGRAEYKRELREFLTEVAVSNNSTVLQELRQQGVEISGSDEVITASTRQYIAAQAALIVDDQYEKLEANVKFNVNDSLTKESLPVLNRSLVKVAEEFITGPSVRVGSVNFVSSTINVTRNDVFQTPSTLNQIESFIFTNPSPKAAVCVNLAGRVFTKEEYATSGLLPPLHPNCKSIIVAQGRGNNNPKPLSPEGLTPTGTPDQVAAIRKSVKFEQPSK